MRRNNPIYGNNGIIIASYDAGARMECVFG
jgi:hypothetical protein